MTAWNNLPPEEYSTIDARIYRAEQAVKSSFPGLIRGGGPSTRMFTGGRWDFDTIGFLYGEEIPQRLAAKGQPIDDELLLAFGSYLVSIYGFTWVVSNQCKHAPRVGVRRPSCESVLDLSVDFVRSLPLSSSFLEEPDLSDFMTEFEMACKTGDEKVAELLRHASQASERQGDA